MKDLIRKILKEDFDDFGWASEPLDIPTDEIDNWVKENTNVVGDFINRLQTLEDSLPKVDWGDVGSLDTLYTQNTLSVIEIKNELANIHESIKIIKAVVDDLKNSN